jgi:hypothetical protein
VDSQAGSYKFKIENLDVDSLSKARNGVIKDRVRYADYSLGSRGLAIKLSSVSFKGKAR